MKEALFTCLAVFLACGAGGRRNVNAEKPFEENSLFFRRQRAFDAVNIQGKVFVKFQNYDSTKVCKSYELTRKFNDTVYQFTFAAFLPKSNIYNVKVRSVVKLLKTGRHRDYNALTYTYGSDDAPKFRSLMYIDPRKRCMIFIKERTTDRKPRCQLMMPAANVRNREPILCKLIFHRYCPGPRIRVYQPWCKNLTSVTIESLGYNEPRRE